MSIGGGARIPAPDSQRAASTRMFREAAQASDCLRAQFERNAPLVARLAEALRARAPRAVVTCARGSSDHAATYARYLVETRLGILSSSASPSVSSLYAARQDLAGCLLLALSQSGRSPDLVAAARGAAADGARVVAIVNDPDAPLARVSHEVVPLHAGPEASVAATKSFLATLGAILHLVSAWSRDAALEGALRAAPAALDAAWALDWSEALAPLATAEHLLVVGRGLGLAAAQEAALKLKETCRLHAEAFSGAELRHGPIALAGPAVPAFAFLQDDETRAGLERLVRDLVATATPVFVAGGAVEGARSLPSLACDPVIAPLALVASFYRLVNALALARGFDPDSPPHLRKVTETH